MLFPFLKGESLPLARTSLLATPSSRDFLQQFLVIPVPEHFGFAQCRQGPG